jgi:hypothetical protein
MDGRLRGHDEDGRWQAHCDDDVGVLGSERHGREGRHQRVLRMPLLR